MSQQKGLNLDNQILKKWYKLKTRTTWQLETPSSHVLENLEN